MKHFIKFDDKIFNIHYIKEMYKKSVDMLL